MKLRRTDGKFENRSSESLFQEGLSMTNKIITISRQYGSGGREIGKKLAEALGVPFYDNELITMAAKTSGYTEEVFKNAEQQPTGSLLYSLSMMGTANALAFDLPLGDKLFIIQSNIIKEIADKGGCVIVGRCADYVLKDNPNCVKFYIHADMASRVERATKLYGLDKNKAEEKIQKFDKKRASYYNYYTNLKWGVASNYNLTVDSSVLGTEKTVDLLKRYVEAI